MPVHILKLCEWIDIQAIYMRVLFNIALFQEHANTWAIVLNMLHTIVLLNLYNK